MKRRRGGSIHADHIAPLVEKRCCSRDASAPLGARVRLIKVTGAGETGRGVDFKMGELSAVRS